MNIPTLIVALIVAALFVAIVVSEYKKKKSGKGSCSCGCSGCSMSDVCHGKDKK